VGLVLSVHLLHGQIAPFGIYNGDRTVVQTDSSDSIVQLTADTQGLQLIPPDQTPFFGTFWTIMPGAGPMALPFPCPPPGQNPTYMITGGIYLVDETATTNAVTQADLAAQATAVVNVIAQVQAATASEQSLTLARATSDGIPAPGGGAGSDDVTNSPNGWTDTPPDYGTNLFLEITNLSGSWVNLVISNTAADVEYEIQGLPALTPATNWTSEGFVYGSESTNWTPTTIAAFSPTTNLFLRIRSWADDGSGLPLWWQLQYFGRVGVNPYASPAGDGYSNLYKFLNGMNPHTFYPPPAPTFTVAPATNDNSAVISWNPAQGAVVSYTLYENGSAIATVPSTQFYFADSTPVNLTDPVDADYSWYGLQVNYANSSAAAPLQQSINPQLAVTPAVVRGAQGQYLLLVPNMPAGVVAIRLYFQPNSVDYPEDFINACTYAQPVDNFTPDTATNLVDVPVSAFTPNGEYALPASLLPPYGDYSSYSMTCRALGANGSFGPGSNVWQAPAVIEAESAVVAQIPFVDGTEPLKENLVFQLESADEKNPFSFSVSGACASVAFQKKYAWAGFYFSPDELPIACLNPFQPFEDNYFYRNFVYAATNVNSAGALASGASYAGGVQIPNDTLFSFPEYDYVTTGGTNDLQPQLSATNNQWIYTGYQPASPDQGYVGISEIGTNLFLNGGQANLFGLPYESVNRLYSDGPLFINTLNSGNGSLPNVGFPEYFYSQVAPPQLQSDGYIFRIPNQDDLPGEQGFSPNNTNLVPAPVILGVSQPLLISAWEKEEIVNGTSGKFGFLEQYFDQAYLADSNGNFNTNRPTGILSEYGDFLATDPGDTFLTTKFAGTNQGRMPVYAIALAADVNHDGVIDPSFGSPDFTTPAQPMQFWCNNNYDRQYYDSDDAAYYEDDVVPQGTSYTSTFTPDCNYTDQFGHRIIPTKRDLEDFTRLWICGVTSNLLAALPSGSSVTLSWGDVGNPNPANPTIDLFAAADADGGLGYLTNDTVAAQQTNILLSPYIQRLGPGQSIQLTCLLNQAPMHFIWCGVSHGTGGLTLTISDASGNPLALTSLYLQIQDIKQMYERWTVGDDPNLPPINTPYLETENAPGPSLPAFSYPPPVSANTPYILFVHGWNMTAYDKDRFAESAFKRLYWQGYQGRFGEFRWPTDYGFNGLSTVLTNINEADNFDNSEYQAWQSAQGLLNKLNDLNSQYPGHVYLLAHSMGNVVAGEALRLSGANQVVNTCVASQAAVSAHTYDATVPNYSFYLLGISFGPFTPNIYGDWLAGNYGGGASSIVNFYNTNDYALSRYHWQFDELVKPDQNVLENGDHCYYGYDGSPSDPAPWNNFYKQDTNSMIFDFNIVTSLNNRYEVMAYAAQSYTTALGATPSVGNVSGNIYLGRITAPRIWPPDPTGNNYTEHFWHSAEFRGDNVMMQGYWSELLGSDAFNLK